MGEITSENLAFTCALRYARIRASPPVSAAVVTQLVTHLSDPLPGHADAALDTRGSVRGSPAGERCL
jgi:hypothetical protein